MSYEVNYSGEIRIDPPIFAEMVAAAGFPEPGRYGDKDVALKVVEEPAVKTTGSAFEEGGWPVVRLDTFDRPVKLSWLVVP